MVDHCVHEADVDRRETDCELDQVLRGNVGHGPATETFASDALVRGCAHVILRNEKLV